MAESWTMEQYLYERLGLCSTWQANLSSGCILSLLLMIPALGLLLFNIQLNLLHGLINAVIGPGQEPLTDLLPLHGRSDSLVLF